MPPKRSKKYSGSSAGGESDGGQEFLQVWKDMTEQAPPPLPTLPPQVNEETKAMIAMREFKRQNPPIFKGEANPTIAEEWLEDIEKILDALKIEEANLRITLAVYQSSGKACGGNL
ncbi:hypothetical protein ACFX15_039700 [Malus domestica]|uniref:Uncharacterized protein n=1 Tax=Malus domestica TaxID=3750 RepID=A0A498JHZ3_MALDO|nr:hypothetical protein DVH24_013878 [Malus domestica]